ncbi:IS1595 family transposase [Trichloromonas sp.]|uniref:IS1595 family transposase n=1 Tax=Trichloromonas sp. TaxID=3069249 RepID=UPI002A3B05E6|nr:IS1595 family transposase [Trichloromonas sp.]
MKLNRIQMQPGMSLNQFLSEYGTERQCEAVLEQSRWPQGFQCPDCMAKDHFSYFRGRVKVFQCRACRSQTTLTEGTIFHSTKLPLTAWFQAMYFLSQNKNNVSILELRRLTGLSYPAAWRMKHKLMQVMYEREITTKLSGRVEIDDAYLGGENPGGKAGRGSENKIPFIAAVQTNNQNNPLYVVFSKVKTFSREEITAWATRSLVPSATVVSDGLWCFKGVTDIGCSQQREVVGKGRKSTDMECFTWVNTILGNLKTAIAGTYHSFDFEKYAHRYLGEYQYRFNRRFDLARILPRLITAATQTGKRTDRWLRHGLAED